MIYVINLALLGTIFLPAILWEKGTQNQKNLQQEKFYVKKWSNSMSKVSGTLKKKATRKEI